MAIAVVEVKIIRVNVWTICQDTKKCPYTYNFTVEVIIIFNYLVACLISLVVA